MFNWIKIVVTFVLAFISAFSGVTLGLAHVDKKSYQHKKEHVLFENRLQAMLNVSSAMSKVTAVYFKPSAYGHSDKDIQERYKMALSTAREVINRYCILFDLGYNQDLDRYYEIHSQMSNLPVEEWNKYSEYLAHLSNELDVLCQSRIKGDTSFRMTVSNISFGQRIKMSPKELIDKHYENWKNSKCNN